MCVPRIIAAGPMFIFIVVVTPRTRERLCRYLTSQALPGYAAVATTVNKVIIVITAGYAVAITTVQRSNVRSRIREYKSSMSILILKIHKR